MITNRFTSRFNRPAPVQAPVRPVSGSPEAFIAALGRLSPAEWAGVALNSATARERLWIWDEAWEAAVAHGGYRHATAAMALAAERGAGRVVQALAGGAAAALGAGSALTSSQFDELYAPFAQVVPTATITPVEAKLAAAG